MTKLEQLAQKQCQCDVKHMTIADLCDSLQKGTLKQSELLEYGQYPVMNSGRTFYGRYNKNNNSANAITIASRGEYAGFVSYINEPFWAGGLCYPYRSKNESVALTKYIFYALKNEENRIMKTFVAHGSIPALNKEDIERFQIPVPPLPVQEEIVRILDKFTELEAELAQELARRKLQYTFYRDKLLSFESPIQQRKLSDVVVMKRGVRVVRQELDDSGKYPVYQNSLKPLGKYDKSNCKANTTFVIAAGAAGEVGYSDIEFWAADDCYYFECPTEIIDARFLYFVLLSQKHKIDKMVRKASIPRIARESIESLTVPVPSLNIQKRLVHVLDNFDAICSDLSIGLPAEIAAREKAYVYYRDLLINYAANGLDLSRAEQSRAEQSRAEQSRAEQMPSS